MKRKYHLRPRTHEENVLLTDFLRLPEFLLNIPAQQIVSEEIIVRCEGILDWINTAHAAGTISEEVYTRLTTVQDYTPQQIADLRAHVHRFSPQFFKENQFGDTIYSLLGDDGAPIYLTHEGEEWYIYDGNPLDNLPAASDYAN